MGCTMNQSPDVDEILRQVRSVREARSRSFERDMHFINATYDRKIRRIQASTIWNRACCTCFSSKPFCVRRFVTRRVKLIRRRLVS